MTSGTTIAVPVNGNKILSYPEMYHKTFRYTKPMKAKNVLGTELKDCSLDPVTGFYRSGCCDTGLGDIGMHVVCAKMTKEFLEFSQKTGNDLSTPRPEFGFEGLKPGDQWCLCASRWQEALAHNVAPPVILSATHEKALELLAFDDLVSHALAEALN